MSSIEKATCREFGARPRFSPRFSSFLLLLFSTVAWSTPQEPKLPEGPGKETFGSVCSLCHATSIPMGKQFTRQEWELKVTEMLQEEPDVTREERAAILEYVSANFKPGGRIYMNIARAAAGERLPELRRRRRLSSVIGRVRVTSNPLMT